MIKQFRLASMAAMCSTACLLAACGGGDAGNSNATLGGAAPAANNNGGNYGGNNGNGGTGTPSTSACAQATVNDAWINNRLGCLRVGQQLIDTASGATGIKADVAFIINEQVLDLAFSSVTPGKTRYFKYFLCVRNAPASLDTSGKRLNLASDLAVAIGTANGSTTKPPGVSAISLTIAGGNQSGSAQMACNPSTHPVIVNYDTGKIESINVNALDVLETYDL